MAESKMQLEDWLDDLCVRFIIHLPKEDLSSVARICFQVEEAQWFYEDFIRPLDPALPSMSLRSFCLRIFQHCPLLAPFSVENHTRAFEEFLQYKTRVPVRGAILLNAAMDSTVLVKGWKKSASWSFPRGKINKDEDDLDCAIREVYEETGFDIREAGLVPKDDEVKYIQISMREQQIRLYVFRNIPMDTVFEPKTRKEISKVQWYKLSELPAFRKKGNDQDDAPAAPNASKFYMVAPFLVPLKKWVVRQTKKDAARAAASSSQLGVQAPAEEPLTEDDIGAQTEPVAAASNGTPAIETLEGANLELQRLLQARPPTQGLQVNPSTASNPSKGEALMALLQKRDVGAPFQQAQQPDPHVPHTPFDHIYSSAPEPHTPHHHHPTQRLPVTNSQPPPNFPTLPGTTHHVSSGFFNQARAQALPQVYGRNPFSDPAAPMPQKEPVLLHPQPLPPQVQQSLLTRGILPTPGLPDTAGQGGLQAQEKGPNPFMARRNDAYAPQQPVKPTQLSGHAMRLLDAFKASARDPHENQPPVKAPEGSASLQGRHQPAVPSSVPAAAQSFNPAAQYLPHHMVLGATQPPQAAAPMPKPAQPTDSHRSALLDIFKRSGPRSPLSNEITARSGRAQDSVGFAKQEEPGSPASKAPSAAEAIASASEANGAPVQMNPDVTLPYRAVQILSRPRQADQARSQDFASTQAQMQRLQQRLSPRGPARHELGSTACPGPPSPRDRALLHQREQAAERSPQLNYAAAQAASLPYARPAPQSPSSAYGVPPFHQPQPTGGVQRHKEANPEQRQKLLSLFGKEQPSPTGLAADYKGKAVERVVSEQPRSGTPRFRGASFASTGAAEPATGSSSTSRRGSQTPISPANRSFLLSYLESVSNSAR